MLVALESLTAGACYYLLNVSVAATLVSLHCVTQIACG